MNKLRFCTALVLTLILGASYATKGGVCTYNSITNDNDGDRKIYKVEGKLTWTIVDGRVTFKDEHSSDSSTDSSIFFLTRMINAREGKSKKGFEIPRTTEEDKAYGKHTTGSYKTSMQDDNLNLKDLNFTLHYSKKDTNTYVYNEMKYTIIIDHKDPKKSHASYNGSGGGSYGGWYRDIDIDLECTLTDI